jgi:tetratricopeptide (TPR) repeat protein
MDMLLHYAVAELQDAVGLIEDRDRTVAAALALQPEPIDSPEQIQEIGQHDNMLMYEHWYVGWYLKQRFHLHWAMAHFQKVMETGGIWLRVRASAEAAEAALYLADYSAAAAYWGRSIEILNSPDYTQAYDPSEQIQHAQRQIAYCLAENAAAEENWTAVQEIILKQWAAPNVAVASTTDVDIVILAYRLCKQNPNIDQEFKDCVESMLKRMWQIIVLDFDGHPELRAERTPGTCNLAAWLLANTDGNYKSAATLIEAALKTTPDDVSFLDTLAHVHFLGGKIDGAIHTQEQVVRMAPEAVIFQNTLLRFKQAKNGK